MLPRVLTTLVVISYFSFTESSVICSTTGAHCQDDRECCSSSCNEGYCGWITSGVKGIANVKTVQSGVKTYDPTIRQAAGIEEVIHDKKVFIPGVKGIDVGGSGVFSGERGYHDTDSYSDVICSDETDYSSGSSSVSNGFTDLGLREQYGGDYSESGFSANEKAFSSEIEGDYSGDSTNNRRDVPTPNIGNKPSPDTRHEPSSSSSEEQSYELDPDGMYKPRPNIIHEPTSSYSQEPRSSSSQEQNYELDPGSIYKPRPSIIREPTSRHSQEQSSSSSQEQSYEYSYEPGADDIYKPNHIYEPTPENWPDPTPHVNRQASPEIFNENQCIKDLEICRQDSECCSWLCDNSICVPNESGPEGDGRDGDDSNPVEPEQSSCQQDYSTCYQATDCCSLKCFGVTRNAGVCSPKNPPMLNHPSEKEPERSFTLEYSQPFNNSKVSSTLENISPHPFDRGYSEKERVLRPLQIPPGRTHFENLYFPSNDWWNNRTGMRSHPYQLPLTLGLNNRNREYQKISYLPYSQQYGINRIPESKINRPLLEVGKTPVFGKNYLWEHAVEPTTNSAADLVPVGNVGRKGGVEGYDGTYPRTKMPREHLIWQPYGLQSQVRPFRTNNLETDYGFRDIQKEPEPEIELDYSSSGIRTYSLESTLYPLDERDYMSLIDDPSSIDEEERNLLSEERHWKDYGYNYGERRQEPQKTIIWPTHGVKSQVNPFRTNNLETDYVFRDVKNEFEYESSILEDVNDNRSPKRTYSVELVATSDERHYNEDSGTLETQDASGKGNSFERDNFKPEGSSTNSDGNDSELLVIPHIHFTSSSKTMSKESNLGVSTELQYNAGSGSLETKDGTDKISLETDYGFRDRENEHESDLSELPGLPHSSSPKRPIELTATSEEIHHNTDSESLKDNNGASIGDSFVRDHFKSEESFIDISGENNSELSVLPHLPFTSSPKRTMSMESTLATSGEQHFDTVSESLKTENDPTKIDSFDDLVTDHGFRDSQKENESKLSELSDIPHPSSPTRTMSVELITTSDGSRNEDSLARESFSSDESITVLSIQHGSELSFTPDLDITSSPKSTISVVSNEANSYENGFTSSGGSIENEEGTNKDDLFYKDNLETKDNFGDKSISREPGSFTLKDLSYSSLPIRKLSVETAASSLNDPHYASFSEHEESEESLDQVDQSGNVLTNKYESELSVPFNNPYISSHERPLTVESTLATSNENHSSFDESVETEKESSQVHPFVSDDLESEEGLGDNLDAHSSETSALEHIPYISPPIIASSVDSTLDGSDENPPTLLERSLEKEKLLKDPALLTGMFSSEPLSDNSVEYTNDYNEGDDGKRSIPKESIRWLSHAVNKPDYPVGRDYSEIVNVPYSRTPNESFGSEMYEQNSGSMEETVQDYNNIGHQIVPQKGMLWLSHGVNKPQYPVGRNYSETVSVPYYRTPNGSFGSELYKQNPGSMEETVQDYNNIGQQYGPGIKGGWNKPLGEPSHGLQYIAQQFGRGDAGRKMYEEYLRRKSKLPGQVYPLDWNYYRFKGNRDYMGNNLIPFKSAMSGGTNINYPKSSSATFYSKSYPPNERPINTLQESPSDGKLRVYQGEVYPYYGRVGMLPNRNDYLGKGLVYAAAPPLLNTPEEYIFKEENASRNDSRRRRICKMRRNRKKCRHGKRNGKCITSLHKSNHKLLGRVHSPENGYKERIPPETIRETAPTKTVIATDILSKTPNAHESLRFGDMIRLGAQRIVG